MVKVLANATVVIILQYIPYQANTLNTSNLSNVIYVNYIYAYISIKIS